MLEMFIMSKFLNNKDFEYESTLQVPLELDLETNISLKIL